MSRLRWWLVLTVIAGLSGLGAALTGGCSKGSQSSEACQSDQACPTAKPRCDTTSHTCVQCVEASDCGTGMACSPSNTCFACNAGATCTSTNACHTAALVCSSGAPVCTDDGDVPNGTNCGSGKVCGNGVCNPCIQGADCSSTNPCDATANVDCKSGFPVCTDRTFQPAGTSCGTNMVCDPDHACTSCNAGQTCTSTDPCHTAAIVRHQPDLHRHARRAARRIEQVFHPRHHFGGRCGRRGHGKYLYVGKRLHDEPGAGRAELLAIGPERAAQFRGGGELQSPRGSDLADG